MKQIFSQFLIIMLAMLQFVAPLVHAHAGSQHFSQGIHIPGLEAYVAINNDKHSTSQLAAINTADWEQEGYLVVVDQAIKKPNDKAVINHSDDFASLPVETPNNPCLFADSCEFNKQYQLVIVKNTVFHLPSRAPPATISYA